MSHKGYSQQNDNATPSIEIYLAVSPRDDYIENPVAI
jgi:hypothetical protein